MFRIALPSVAVKGVVSQHLSPFSTCTRGAPHQWRARWVKRGGIGLTAATGLVLCASEGLRRCAEFWIVVLPIYLHYLYVDKVSHPKEAAQALGVLPLAYEHERDGAFERLHCRYSPIIERATLYMRGFYLKTAQLMSMREDFVPEQYLRWTKRLQSEAPVALTPTQARQLVASELGLQRRDGALDEVFSDWVDEPIGSASIGQVYKATRLSTGEKVAVKVQAPGAEGLFYADIRTLQFFTSLALPWAVDNMRAIERLFRAEFDYSQEQENLEEVRRNLLPRFSHRVQVPKPIPELSTQRVLCMELMRGEPLIDAVRRRMRAMATREGRHPDAYEESNASALRSGAAAASSPWVAHLRHSAWRSWRWLRWGDAENAVDLPGIVETLMDVHGQQVFTDGVFNADPHPGNIFLLEDGRTLGLIDFGQVRRLPLEFRLNLARLVVALARHEGASMVASRERALGVESRKGSDDVRYRFCSFWLDRDTEEILQGRNIHDFLAWCEQEDPVLRYPEDLYLVCRCSVMLRSLGLAFGVRLSTAQYWRPHAERLLKEHGCGA